MARMYSRKRGQSGSTKPKKLTKPAWIEHEGKEVELLVTKFAKEGLTSSQIGTLLRDQYGVPDVKVVTGKKIMSILESKNLTGQFPEDLMALFKKVAAIKEHLLENHKDQPARRGLLITESKILKLVKYYKITGKIALDWNYDPKRIKMYIQ